MRRGNRVAEAPLRSKELQSRHRHRWCVYNASGWQIKSFLTRQQHVSALLAMRSFWVCLEFVALH